MFTPHLLVTLALFSSAAVVVAVRTVVGSTYGFSLAGERKLEVGAARAAITHAGYLAGSFVGGAALAAGGHAAIGVAFGLLFLAGAAHTSRHRGALRTENAPAMVAALRQPQSA